MCSEFFCKCVFVFCKYVPIFFADVFRFFFWKCVCLLFKYVPIFFCKCAGFLQVCSEVSDRRKKAFVGDVPLLSPPFCIPMGKPWLSHWNGGNVFLKYLTKITPKSSHLVQSYCTTAMLVVGGFVSCKEIGVSSEWWPPARFSLSQWLLDQTQSLLSSLELVIFCTWNLFILKVGRFAAGFFWRALFYCVYCFLNPTLAFTIIWRELGVSLVFFAAFDNCHFQIFDEISPWQWDKSAVAEWD